MALYKVYSIQTLIDLPNHFQVKFFLTLERILHTTIEYRVSFSNIVYAQYLPLFAPSC